MVKNYMRLREVISLVEVVMGFALNKEIDFLESTFTKFALNNALFSINYVQLTKNKDKEKNNWSIVK